MIRVAIVDPDAALAKALAAYPDDVAVARENTAAALMARVDREDVDLIFLASELPDAVSTLERIKRAHPDTEVVLTAGASSMEMAFRAMKLGAGDYLVKPVRPEQVAVLVERARRVRKLAEENRQLRERLKERFPESPMVGSTAPMRRLLDRIASAAISNGALLILGEAGVGKELAARTVHQESPRRDRPFVAVDCGGNRIEAELLGAQGSPGAIERASGGTLFLREIAELPQASQAAIVRAIDDRVARSVDANADVAVDARVIAATSRNLLEAMGLGTFRNDLFARLSADTIAVPPLRERLDDVPLLVDAFLKRRAAAGKRVPRAISAEALTTLLSYGWPGNVGELELAVERACDLGDGDMLERRHLPPSVIQAAEARRKEGAAAVGTQSLREMESEVIQKLLADHHGDTEAVSKLLKIDRSTLYRKIKRYGITLDDLKQLPPG